MAATRCRHRTHRQILQRLKSVLPKGSAPSWSPTPDSGVGGFVAWRPLDWTGLGASVMESVTSNPRRGVGASSILCTDAKRRMRHTAWRCLSRRNRYCCRMYPVRAPRPAPSGPRKRRVQRAKYRQLHRAAWLLALQPHHRGAGNCTRCIYAQRVQVAECFPDVKSHRRGFPLRYARTIRPDRLQPMRLVAVLETLILWLLGPAASNWRWDRHFQPTIERRRPVLSTVYLGQELWLANPPLQIHSHRAVRCSETPPAPRHPGGSVRIKSLGSLGREEPPFVHQIPAQLRFPHHMYGRRLLLR